MTMNKYHKRFLRSDSAENVIGVFSRYKGAAKEITESWSMLEAAKKYCPNLNDRRVIVVGDGCSPRTGIIFAYYTKAKVDSIDPQINLSHWDEHVLKQNMLKMPIQRLAVWKHKVENLKTSCNNADVLVVWPHSHASMNSLSLANYGNRMDIAMPCCTPIPRNWMEIPHIVYDDYNVESPKRTIHIWKNTI